MTNIHAIILGILQGVTEFFPISSSGHLVLMQQFLGIHDNVLVFYIFVHFGTLLAVLVVFRAAIRTLITGCFESLRSVIYGGISIGEAYNSSHEIRTITGIIIGTIPAVIVSITLKDFIESLFHSVVPVFAALFFTGCILLVTFFTETHNRRIGAVYGFLIGLSQALAILPGISRSGMTISTALFLGVRRDEAGEFSFLLSIPVILGASILAVKDFIYTGFPGMSWEAAVIGTSSAFISGWISLVLLMRLVRHGKIGYFGYYCLVIAVLGFILYGSGALHGDVKRGNIEIISSCTVCNKSLYFSHRRDNQNAGRMMGYIMIKPE